MHRVLLILNRPAYGADETCNAIRLAIALTRREDTEVTVFLMGDAVTCAVTGQRTPDGYYALDRMLRTVTRHGGHLAHLLAEVPRATIDELAAWTVQADQVVTF